MTSRQVAVVTGAGRGIGQASAIALARDGFAVVVLDIDGATAESTAADLQRSGHESLGLAADVALRPSFETAIQTVLSNYGRMDVLVNNAMWVRYRPTIDVEEGEMDRMIGVGLKATIWGAQLAATYMDHKAGGSVINLASPAAEMGVPGAAVYSAVKGGVVALTRSLAVELAPLRIRVNAVSPGATPTPGAMAINPDAAFAQARIKRTPLGRLAEPADIAEGIAFLASDRSRYITGHILKVDGGITINGS
jgi:NAD(P)-dependent dehydrogenase (short-subunit alcohol dehydrogenase family)